MTETLSLSEAARRLMPLLDALPPAERIGLARYIWKSVDVEEEGIPPDEIRAAWTVEILRRLEDVKSGKVQPIPIEEMFQKSRERHP